MIFGFTRQAFGRLMAAASLILSSAIGADAARYALNVADFASLSVDNGINVEYVCKQDSAGWVTFECEPDAASKILLSNNKSNLRIQLDIDEGIPSGIPAIRVYSSALKSVSNSGDSLVVVHLINPNEKFTAKVIGNGRIEVHNLNAHKVEAKVTAGRGAVKLDGKTVEARLFIAGTGSVDAGGLEAEEVRSSSIGPGHIICRTTKKLAVGGLSGRVYYMTEPEEISRRGMVKALPIDSLQ